MHRQENQSPCRLGGAGGRSVLSVLLLPRPILKLRCTLTSSNAPWSLAAATPFRERDERSIYYTLARTVVSDVFNSSACSDICSWLKSEKRKKKGKNPMHLHTLARRHTTPHPLTHTHDTLRVLTHTWISLFSFPPLLARLPQACSPPPPPSTCPLRGLPVGITMPVVVQVLLWMQCRH